MSRRTRTSLLGLLGLAAAAAIVGVLSERSRVVRAAGPAVEDVGENVASLATRVRPPPAADASSAGPVVADAPEPRRLRVFGRVDVPAGTVVEGAKVHVSAAEASEPRSGRSERVLAVGRASRDGTYAAEVAAFPTWADGVRALVEVPGAVVVYGEAPVDSKALEVRVDVDVRSWLGAESRVTDGRVVDASGNPLAGLRVIVQSFPGTPEMIPVDWLEARIGPAAGLRGVAVTDADGRYAIRGLRCGGCARAFSATPEWFLLQDAGNREVVRGEAELRAWPATRLTLDVEDDAGSPLPSFAIDVQTGSDSPLREQGRDGHLDVLWPNSPAARHGVTEVAVEAEGRRTSTFELPPAFGPRSHRAKVRLSSLGRADRGSLGLVVRGEGAKEIGSKPTVVLRAPGTGLPLHVLDFAAGESGQEFSARVPVGEWDCEFRPWWPEHVLVRGRAHVVVRAGATERVEWEVPALASVRVFLDDRRSDVGTVRLTRPGTEPVEFSLEDSALVPAGDWTVEVRDVSDRLVAQGPAHLTGERFGGIVHLAPR